MSPDRRAAWCVTRCGRGRGRGGRGSRPCSWGGGRGYNTSYALRGGPQFEDPEARVTMARDKINVDLTCPICLSIVKDTVIVMGVRVGARMGAALV